MPTNQLPEPWKESKIDYVVECHQDKGALGITCSIGREHPAFLIHRVLEMNHCSQVPNSFQVISLTLINFTIIAAFLGSTDTRKPPSSLTLDSMLCRSEEHTSEL